MREATAEQIEILQHSLGIDREKRSPWRNYYCDEAGAPQLEALVSLGLMSHGRAVNESQRYYHVTAAGVAVAVDALPAPYSRSKQRYRRFLSVSDVMPDLTFRDFLRMDARG